MSEDYYEEQQEQNQNEEQKQCEKCNNIVDEIYYSSCNHSFCLDCLLANFISCNFKGLYPNQNILSCPKCWRKSFFSIKLRFNKCFK